MCESGIPFCASKLVLSKPFGVSLNSEWNLCFEFNRRISVSLLISSENSPVKWRLSARGLSGKGLGFGSGSPVIILYPCL